VTLSARILSEFSAIGPADWDRLDHRDNPFLSHAFLTALEQSGSVDPAGGWTPQHLALYEGSELVAFAPTYLKNHSHGEFVFDWAWADAYHRMGLAYYPKLLTAIPYSPVRGPRLLTRRGHPDPETLRRELVAQALELCTDKDLSTWHCNFVQDHESAVLDSCGLLPRHDWQFHWHNDNYADFEDFLARLRSRKRKNIRRERRRVREAGVEFRWLNGREVDPTTLDFLYTCYSRTFNLYHNHAALNREFFERLARGLGERFVLIIADRGDRPLAMSLFLAGGGRLYGRYWGCVEELPDLHFETAYYQGIDYCIANGIRVFESGAQGEHKISRGFLPQSTRSFHFVSDAVLRDAIGRHLRREWQWLDEYREALREHDPFRNESS